MLGVTSRMLLTLAMVMPPKLQLMVLLLLANERGVVYAYELSHAAAQLLMVEEPMPPRHDPRQLQCAVCVHCCDPDVHHATMLWHHPGPARGRAAH